jgi:dTDP-4-amino-4,6-dideoxygalactose transaminase
MWMMEALQHFFALMDFHPLFTDYPREDFLARQHEIESALLRVARFGKYILGAEVDAFEREFADWLGVSHVIGVASGTDAIEVLLRAHGVGPGDAVAVPAHTSVACVSGIIRAGAAPVLVDVDPDTFTLSPVSLEEALTRDDSIRAVLAVHLYGHVADMTRLQSLCDHYNVILLEDGAQAHGATWKGRKAGSLAQGAAFSFYPTKNIGAMGDAGAVATDDAALAGRLRELRQYGWRERGISAAEGINSRMDEIQAAVLRVKLLGLNVNHAARRRLASLYSDALVDFPELIPPIEQPDCRHAYHLYVIRSVHRQALMEHLLKAGIPVAIHYPAAIHQHPAYVGLRHVVLPHTETVVPQILSLPLHPYLSDEAVSCTLDAIHRFTHS